jgi:ABC-type uncharacterized transport system substrate-binding protein
MNFGGLASLRAKISLSIFTNMERRLIGCRNWWRSLVKSRVDVIYATGDIAIRAAQQATATIPIIGYTEDMVGSGLVNSLARPGGNTTGISALGTELNGKRQEILIEAVPGIRHMAALADSHTIASSQLKALQDAARARNVELSIHRFARSEEVVAAVSAAKASGAEALRSRSPGLRPPRPPASPPSRVASLPQATRCCARLALFRS